MCLGYSNKNSNMLLLQIASSHTITVRHFQNAVSSLWRINIFGQVTSQGGKIFSILGRTNSTFNQTRKVRMVWRNVSISLKCSTFKAYFSKQVPWETDLNKNSHFFNPSFHLKMRKKGTRQEYFACVWMEERRARRHVILRQIAWVPKRGHCWYTSTSLLFPYITAKKEEYTSLGYSIWKWGRHILPYHVMPRIEMFK